MTDRPENVQNGEQNGETPRNEGAQGAAQEAYDCTQRVRSVAPRNDNHDVIVIGPIFKEPWSAIQAQGEVRLSQRLN